MIRFNNDGSIEIVGSKLELMFQITDVIIKLKEKGVVDDTDIDYIATMAKRGSIEVSDEELNETEQRIRGKLAMLTAIASATGRKDVLDNVTKTMAAFDDIVKKLHESEKDKEKNG